MKRSYLIGLIVFINVFVYFNWNFPFLYDDNFMRENFLISWEALQQGRYWTLVTPIFSHNMLWHLMLNMYVLLNFGFVIETLLGRWRFLQFYLLAGIISSLSHALISAFVLDAPAVPALGASGAISGLIILFSFVFPKQKLLFFGIIPVPAIFGALLFIGLDIWGLVEQAQGGGLPIGHGAHLGGAFTGLFYYFLFVRSHLRRGIGI